MIKSVNIPSWKMKRFVMYDKTFAGETKHTCIFAPDRDTMIDKSRDTSNVQLGEPIVLLGILV